jgi:hypothetical protein
VCIFGVALLALIAKKNRLKIERLLFEIVIVVTDQDNHVYIIQGILGHKGEI